MNNSLSRSICTAFVLTVLGLLLASNAHAKCPKAETVISGKVLDNEGKAISGASVLLFFDTHIMEADAYNLPESSECKSDLDGNFKCIRYFSKYSGTHPKAIEGGIIAIDKCGAEIHLIDVIVLKNGYIAGRKLFNVTPCDANKGLKIRVDIDAIKLLPN